MISRKLPRAKPPKSRMLFTGLSCGIEVEEPRYRVQFLFQNQHTLVLDDVADFAVFVEEVPELASAHRANFDARRIAPGTGTLDAEGALFDDALGARPVAQVVSVGIELLVGNGWLLPVEMPRPISSAASALPAVAASIRRKSGRFSTQNSASASSLSKIGTSSQLAKVRIKNSSCSPSFSSSSSSSIIIPDYENDEDDSTRHVSCFTACPP